MLRPSIKEQKIIRHKAQKVIRQLHTTMADRAGNKGKVDPNRVTLQKMASKKFEGWRIKLDQASCGFVKFSPKIDDVFQKHATVDFSIPVPQRGRHIGRFALQKAIAASTFLVFVAHLRKGNIASQKALKVIGFSETTCPGSKQLCMVFRKHVS